MTDRLSDIGAHIATVKQLGGVVNAMRGIAAARARQARNQLAAVDSYAAMIATTIGQAQAIAVARMEPGRGVGRGALVLFLAEEGFAGAFSERVLDAGGPAMAESDLFLVGTRGIGVARERGIDGAWHRAMPSHSLGIPKTIDGLTDALFGRIASGAVDRVDAIFSRRRQGAGLDIAQMRLLPIDPEAFPQPAQATTPLLNLGADALLDDLTGDYLHAQLCAAALHAFAAENEARMEAMAAAHSQIEQQLTVLEATQRQVRQEEITAEIIELAAGETASRGDRR